MNNFPMYDINFISGSMSLRNPQLKSLEILDDILNHVKLNKNGQLAEALAKVNQLYPICTDFERDFMSLAFVLATGVGKTRLMGAFITYLYTNHNIRNFFIVAPGTTVFNKLKQDFGNPDSEKYVFKGVGCFNNPPQIVTADDYRTKPMALFSSDITIYIYNIDKFNSENTKMRKINEYLGDSFFEHISKLDDLVLIMDESHHYHAEKSFGSLNELKPILGLELTATPYYNNGKKQVPFKNAVYEYPLSESIKDGYTRTPFALTQQNVDFYNFGDEELDKVMILDGLRNHENIKKELEVYAINNNMKKVKPFVMIVCKDTQHAESIFEFVTSSSCKNGIYKRKTLLIHTNQKKADKDKNIQLLLDVEKYDNPVEIVIHVDMLKEGWDVNNLYTIIPLRTASSKILREQMVGRGLRLPFGKRTGEKYLDAVMLTAHGKFDDILNEARKGDSIFKAGNVIYVEELDNTEQEFTQIPLIDLIDVTTIEKELEENNLPTDDSYKNFIKTTNDLIKEKISENLLNITNRREDINKEKVKEDVLKVIKEDEDLSEIYRKNKNPLDSWITYKTEEVVLKTMDNFIPIPLIKITDSGIEDYKFVDFNLDFSNMQYFPSENNIILQNLEKLTDREIIKGDSIVLNDINPGKEILSELRKKSEIDYEKSATLLFKLINEFLEYYLKKYDEHDVKNIVVMNKKSIANAIHKQLFSDEHFYYSCGIFDEKIVDVSRTNKTINYSYKEKKDLFSKFKGSIVNNLFIGLEKCVHDRAKFHSEPELTFARLIEQDGEVIRWLRPHKEEFNLFYNRNKRYEPDFVVETKDSIYLVEIKGEDKLNDVDVIAKKERAIKYCKIASDWAKANNYKEWKHLFIPSQEIKSTVSFDLITKKYIVE